MREHCAQCLTAVPEDLGYETPHGETLCGPCYFALWGPRGSQTLSRASERRRPDSRRPARGQTVWMVPGPSGELDPEEPIRRRRWLRRRRSG